MKVITLNIWGGLAGKQVLLDFFAKHKDSVDVFCLQEVWSAPYEHVEGYSAGSLTIDNSKAMVYGLQEISKILSNFQPFFRPHHGDHYGLLMLVSNKYVVEEEGESFVHKHKGYMGKDNLGNHARNIQYIKLKMGDGETPLTVINFHGLWNGQGKTDSDDRLLQSKKILDFIKDINSELVFCGDFNLRPDTQSIKMLEDSGLKNLIKDYAITSTRTSLYSKPEKYADYIFVSPGLTVKNFEVLPDEVSDHSPLLLEI